MKDLVPEAKTNAVVSSLLAVHRILEYNSRPTIIFEVGRVAMGLGDDIDDHGDNFEGQECKDKQ